MARTGVSCDLAASAARRVVPGAAMRTIPGMSDVELLALASPARQMVGGEQVARWLEVVGRCRLGSWHDLRRQFWPSGRLM